MGCAGALQPDFRQRGRFDLGLGVLVPDLAVEDVGVDVPDEEGIGVAGFEMSCSGNSGCS